MNLILTYIRRHIGMFATALFFLSLETLADLMQPTFMSYIVDNGVKGQSISKILMYGAMMLGIAALGALGAVMRNIYAAAPPSKSAWKCAAIFTGKSRPFLLKILTGCSHLPSLRVSPMM
ncbi:MAG: hypothetical protein ACLVAW_10980 [Eisenbergiella massiliensis]